MGVEEKDDSMNVSVLKRTCTSFLPSTA